MATSKLRLDELLVARSLADDLRTAQALVLAGQVVVGERRADKPGEQVRPDVAVRLKDQPGPYVSRGGLKLAAALDGLNVDVRGLSCADVGASTGGFSDCLLQRGAARVVAIDVGYGLLHDKLRRDPRVTVRERTHARELTAAGLPFAIELLVADLSFIGLQPLLPVLLGVVAAGGRLVLMVKPQFEAARSEVPTGGVIADSELAARIVERVALAARAHGAHVLGTAAAGVAGPAGNREVFLALRTPQ